MNTTIHDRRSTLLLLAKTGLATPLLLLSSCEKQEELPSDTSASEEGPSRASKIARGFALTGLMIGERLVQFPHPVIRIIAVTLVVGSAITMTILSMEYRPEEFSIRLTSEESSKIDSDSFVNLVREDGQLEKRAFDERKYS